MKGKEDPIRLGIHPNQCGPRRLKGRGQMLPQEEDEAGITLAREKKPTSLSPVGWWEEWG